MFFVNLGFLAERMICPNPFFKVRMPLPPYKKMQPLQKVDWVSKEDITNFKISFDVNFL